MFRNFLITAFTLTLCAIAFGGGSLSILPAYAACSSALFDHNGSKMEAQVCEKAMVIIYKNPRSVLHKHGVQSGTELFRGEVYVESGSAVINGQANVFLKGCGSKSYDVSGTMEGNSIIMTGQAPVRASNCKVRKYRDDRLLFTGL